MKTALVSKRAIDLLLFFSGRDSLSSLVSKKCMGGLFRNSNLHEEMSKGRGAFYEFPFNGHFIIVDN